MFMLRTYRYLNKFFLKPIKLFYICTIGRRKLLSRPCKHKLYFKVLMVESMKRYHSNPLPLGIEVFGIDLSQPINNITKQQILEDVTKYRIVVFRNQGQIEGSRQVEISRWFGDIDNVTYAKHPASPSTDIFRVSNDPNQGCTGVGMSGWHIDGTFRECPYAYSIYHMVSPAINGGDTMFIPLTEIVENLPTEQRARWERLWMMSDRLGNIRHPLIYSHPKTGRPTLCFHQGMTHGFVKDYDLLKSKAQHPHILSSEEENLMRREIQEEIDKATVYSHKWQQSGDFVISDNLAVGHMAGPISSIEESGLRILHRVTVKGTTQPSKQYDFLFADKRNCAY